MWIFFSVGGTLLYCLVLFFFIAVQKGTFCCHLCGHSLYSIQLTSSFSCFVPTFARSPIFAFIFVDHLHFFALSDFGESDQAIPLMNVSAPILQKVVEWCTRHRSDPPPQPEDESVSKRTDDISEWDFEFCKVDQGTLFELILVRQPFSLCG